MRRALERVREGSKISSQTPDEPLIPEPRFPNLWLPEVRGFLPGIAMLALSIIVAWVLSPFLDSPLHASENRGILPADFTLRLILGSANVLIAAVLPGIASVVMLWVAFIRTDVRDRYLWSAVMVLTSEFAVELLNYAAPRPHYRFPFQSLDITSAALVTGTIVYAAAYCALAKGLRRADYGAIAVVALIVLFALPLALGSVSWATALCSLITAAGLWSIGVSIADRVGFDVYGADETDAA